MEKGKTLHFTGCRIETSQSQIPMVDSPNPPTEFHEIPTNSLAPNNQFPTDIRGPYIERSSFFHFIKTPKTDVVYDTSVMHRFTTGIRSEKCVASRFRRCANVIECTYTNLDSTAYCIVVCMVQTIAPRLQTSTACYCTEYCRQL